MKKLFIGSKIQFSESKSQLWFICWNSNGVVYQFKDTIFWKQITTYVLSYYPLQKLFISSKIQFSESKSQRLFCTWQIKNRCLSVQRYNFLKANHNIVDKWLKFAKVVYQFKDTIFWKQITTSFCVSNIC